MTLTYICLYILFMKKTIIRSQKVQYKLEIHPFVLKYHNAKPQIGVGARRKDDSAFTNRQFIYLYINMYVMYL